MLGGTPLHQLVHGPETGESTDSCSLAEVFFFFFFYTALYCATSGPGGKVTASLLRSLPLRVPSGGGTAGWCMPAFSPSFISSSLRPLLSSPVIRVIWVFLLPFIRQLFMFPCLLSSMIVCKLLPHSGRGADFMRVTEEDKTLVDK